MRILIVAAILALAVPARASLLILFGPNQSVVPMRPVGTRTIVSSTVVDASDVHAPIADTIATIVYPATGGRNCMAGVAWSYSATPTGGRLTILDGSNTVFNVVIGEGGYGEIHFPVAKCGNAGTAMSVVLAAGGGAVVGTINSLGHWVEAP